MKLRTAITTALICLTATLAAAVDGMTSVSVVNEDSIPHTITIDQDNRTIRVFAGSGGQVNLPPAQDVAQRARHGTWRVFGDSGREMNVRFHSGQDYRLHLRPYVHGDVKTLVGAIDDGYSHWEVPLADMRRHRHLDDYPQHTYQPRWHGPVPPPDSGYPYVRRDHPESIGHAIHEAFDNALQHINEERRHPYYVDPYHRGW